MLVDSHCHLDFPQLSERIGQVIELMQGNGVGCALCVGVTLEAAACGRATVGTRVGILPDLMPPSYVAPPGDAEGLAASIGSALNEGQSPLVEAKFDLVRTRYSLEQTCADLGEVYAALRS